MLQVASDPPIHAQSHNPPRHPRSAQADRAPSPFESLLERPKRLCRHYCGQSQNFTWNGHGNDGRLSTDGSFIATAVDASEQSVAISTEVQAIEESVDLTQDPPQLPDQRPEYALDKIKRIVRLMS